jgi:predicted RNase H-like nuclease (RuvC/YqgF family)
MLLHVWFKEAQQIIELKQTKINQLKMLIMNQVDEINNLRANNQSMIGQIAESIHRENKIKGQDEVIRDL